MPTNVKVGDVYKNMKGEVVVIVQVDTQFYFSIVGDNGQMYNLKGQHCLTSSPYDLNLSKKYKLVEATDEE